MAANSIYKFLNEGGLAGIAVLLIFACIWLLKDDFKQRDINKDQIQNMYNQLLELTQKKIEAEVQLTIAFKELRKSLDKLIEKVDP
ncbi:MAG: hypothetical protein MJA83_16665 [Gammaproteobacteria bacterium]|nr:hypothetical protein [Gammaproteobacteria bacterium]